MYMAIKSHVLHLSVSPCLAPVLLLLPLAISPLLNCARAFSILIKALVTNISPTHVIRQHIFDSADQIRLHVFSCLYSSTSSRRFTS
jgi:hypothetical protein